MSQITRQSFINTMSNGAASGIDPDGLAPATEQALEAAGITASSLGDIAGADARISGQEELARLFEMIDRVDRNGSTRSIATTARGDDGRLVATPSGAAAQALMDEIEKARVNRDARPQSASPHQRALETLEAAGFTDIHLAKVPRYYNQGQGSWANYAYPKSSGDTDSTRTLKTAGCAPCALAMADIALRGSKTTPREVADFAVDGGFSSASTGFGSDTKGLTRAWAAANDLTLTEASSRDRSENIDTIIAGLQRGGVALASVGIDPRSGQGHFTNTSHVVLINGCAKDAYGQEWFFIANPGRENQERSTGLTTDDEVKQDLNLGPAAGRVRISRDQLVAELRYACVLERRV